MPLSFSRRSGAFAAAVALGIGAALTPTGPAGAAPTVSLLCESGAAILSCDVTYANAQQPVSVRWWVDNTYRPAWDDLTSVAQRCAVGRAYAVRVVVADATGETEAIRRISCRQITP
ncbi:hypothetical protein [Micromonospora sp. NPDC023956]|uniref:hypothetical protein n=1 Tax=Micromonospora sp. NPDC023956 TaxID=3155722 RepID=UPI0033FE1D17